MRTLALIIVLACQGTSSSQPAALLDLAMADDASVTNSMPVTISDHYGNPDAFVKYIIRKPPVIA